ncbi:D-tyrosyl-tRNA(Tyr) deacylase [Methylophaga lonarensis MPL]|uniref:D-aminoacyl-tRNA deacylase n=1 Tax=Methylophaga lonarensis MPL TaxID=1286106 RepID=M7NXM5_9GAMM|nr:D-aminoacyl-tRNA deacylase [Methylophaga lonarensis]EMR13543.1 D-tyrosyl-tRNA(Tyr) deacylase [Methylophaga lonarensis MPL]
MIGLLQRVSQASVSVQGQIIAEIDQGLMVLIGVEHNDTQAQADRLVERIIRYRIFADSQDKMNLSLLDVHGSLLLVPQFTLPADTRKGLRPSFTPAATPTKGAELFDYLVKQASESVEKVASGQFGANMQVALVNDGPVTFWLQT